MGSMSQDEINVGLFDEVQRLRKNVQHYKELAGINVDAYFTSQQKLKRYEVAMQMALMQLEDNNLMNETYHQIHAILDGEPWEETDEGKDKKIK